MIAPRYLHLPWPLKLVTAPVGALWCFEATVYDGSVDVYLYGGVERSADLDAFIADTVRSFGEAFIKRPGGACLWQGTFGPPGVEPLWGVALFVRSSGALHFMAFGEETGADLFFAGLAEAGEGGRVEVFNGAHVAPGGAA